MMPRSAACASRKRKSMDWAFSEFRAWKFGSVWKFAGRSHGVYFLTIFVVVYDAVRLKGVCCGCGCCKQRLERGGWRSGCEGTLDVESSKANRDGKFRWARESATTTQLAGVPTDSFSFERVQPRLSTSHLTSATLDLRVLLSCDLFNSPASYYQTHSTFRIVRRGERNNSIVVIAWARYPGYWAHCLLVHKASEATHISLLFPLSSFSLLA